jgi:hypothetical protein
LAKGVGRWVHCLGGLPARPDDKKTAAAVDDKTTPPLARRAEWLQRPNADLTDDEHASRAAICRTIGALAAPFPIN